MEQAPDRIAGRWSLKKEPGQPVFSICPVRVEGQPYAVEGWTAQVEWPD